MQIICRIQSSRANHSLPSSQPSLSRHSCLPWNFTDFSQECKPFATFNAIYYIFTSCMLLLSSNRVNTVTICPKSTLEQKQEPQGQFDPQEYRLLLSIFAQNINQTLKNHKDCIGEMEFYPACKVARDRKEDSASYLTEIYRKLKCRLAKESLYRNSTARRTRENYAQNYQKAFPEFIIQDSNPKQQNIPSVAVLRKLPFSDIDKYRTVSIKNERRSTTGSYHQKMSIQLQTFKTFQADFSTTLALKTIATDNSASKEPFLRSTKSALSRHERQRRKSNAQLIKNRRNLSIQPQSHNSQDFVFAGNEILISDHRHSGQTHRRQYFKQPISSKVCTKQVVAMNQSHRKIINGIQALHLNAKRIDYCTPLSDDIYAYKPTAKRWQRSFN